MAMPYNFLDSFTSLLARTEIPPRFAIWCGISTLLAALERRLWIYQSIYTVYPNFFIVLVGASGVKKSTAINLVEKLLRLMETPPNFIAQKLSKEQLLSNLSEMHGGIILADELSAFLNQREFDLGMGPVLIKLYDCKDFEQRTFTRGVETVKDSYLSLLGGSTTTLLKTALPRDAIGGGFTSRIIFVYADRRPPPVPRIHYNKETPHIEELLVNHLDQLRALEGPVTITEEGWKFYDSTYIRRHYESDFYRDATLAGYEKRRGVHLFKVAIALMVSENPSTTLTRQHFIGADLLLEEVELGMPAVMELVMSTDIGTIAKDVYRYIAGADRVTKAELHRHFSHRLGPQELSRALDTLTTSRKVNALVERGPPNIFYYEATRTKE